MEEDWEIKEIKEFEGNGLVVVVVCSFVFERRKVGSKNACLLLLILGGLAFIQVI